MINIFDIDQDKVIKSVVAIGRTNYEFALSALVPLLDRFGEQRKLQSRSFYDRLRADIVTGCIMPPVTLAFVGDEIDDLSSKEAVQEFVKTNIEQ